MPGARLRRSMRMARLIAPLLAAALSLPVALAAQPASSTSASPQVTFSTPGEKQVTLQVCNGAECASITRTVVVLDPTPVITSATAALAVVEEGQLLGLAGAGRGKPPLAFTWEALLGAAPVGSLAGPSGFLSTTGLAPGVYTLRLRLQNPVGTALSAPIAVTVLPNKPLDFYTVTPCRVIDTRSSSALVSGAALLVDVVGSGCGVPAGARAIAANVTVIGPTGGGHLTLYPGNFPQPEVSTVNFSAGQVRANHAVLPLATDGTGRLAAGAVMAPTGAVHFILDVSGYFL